MSLTHYLLIDGYPASDLTSGLSDGEHELLDYFFLISKNDPLRPAETSEVVVSLETNIAAPLFLQDMLQNRRIESVQVVSIQPSAGALEIVREVSFGEVQITGYTQDSGSPDTLKFVFQTLSSSYSPDAFRTELTEWDFIQDAPGANISEPNVDATAEMTPEQELYFLAIEGVAGTSTFQGYEGMFEVGGHQLSVLSNLVSGQLAREDAIEWTPLTFQIEGHPFLPAILEEFYTMPAGKAVTLYKLASEDSGAMQLVQTIRLGEAVLAGITFTENLTSVAFDFAQIELVSAAGVGTGRDETSFAYDRAGGSPASVPEATAGSNESRVQPDAYYVIFDEFEGPVETLEFSGAFELSSFKIDIDSVNDSDRRGGLVFKDIELFLDLDAISPFLIEDFQARAIHEGFRIVGYKFGDNQIVTEARFGQTMVTGFELQEAEPDKITFNYRQMDIRTPLVELGGLTAGENTFQYDVPSAGAGSSVTAFDSSTALDATGESHILFAIEGISGPSQVFSHEGSFEIQDFQINAATETSVGTARVPTPTYESVEVTLGAFNLGNLELLSHLLVGQVLPLASLIEVFDEGLATWDRQTISFDNLKLSNWKMNAREGVILTFDFDAIEISSQRRNEFGQLLGEASGSVDTSTSSIGVSVPKAIPAGQVDYKGFNNYLLVVEGLSGSFQPNQFRGDLSGFALEGFDFEIGQSGTIPEMNLFFEADRILPILTEHLLNSDVLPAARLVGHDDSGNIGMEMRLGDAVLSEMRLHAGGADQIKLQIGSIEVEHFIAGPRAGETIGSDVLQWDFSSNQAGVGIGQATADFREDHTEDPIFLMQLEDYEGDVTRSGFEGAFELEGFSLRTSAGQDAGTRDGRPSFEPIVLKLHEQDFANPIFQDLLLRGTILPNVRLLQVGQYNVDGILVEDAIVDLTNAFFVKVSDRISGHSEYHLSFEAIEITSFILDGTGSVAEESSYFWNVSQGQGEPVVPVAGAVDDTYEVEAFGTVAGIVTTNDEYESEAPFALSVVSGPSGGNLTIASDGSFVYRNLSGVIGHDSFVYMVDDGSQTFTATATIKIDSAATAVRGTKVADLLNGTSLTEEIFGGAGNDTLRPNGGNDTLHGGTGRDRIDLSESSEYAGREVKTALYDVVVPQNYVRRSDGMEWITLDSIEEVVGSRFFDRMQGGASDDTFWGLDGDDLILANAGADVLYGGRGEDDISGGSGDDELIGGDDDDILNGFFGDDNINGGTGADLMIGGPGSDNFYVDNKGDRISESRKWAGLDTVYSNVDFRMGNRHIEDLHLEGKAQVGAGNGLMNRIWGNEVDNILDGGKNNDTMFGGLGNDTYLIRAPGDTVIEHSGQGIDVVRAFRSYALEANVEQLHMQNLFTKSGLPANLNGIGNALDNTIIGTPYANTIIGREGRDTLKGQLGADTFVFDRALGPDNVDRIIDFNTNTKLEGDILQIKLSILGVKIMAGTLDTKHFVTGTNALDADDYFVFDHLGGTLYFDADGSGKAAQQALATFEQGAVVTAADILVF